VSQPRRQRGGQRGRHLLAPFAVAHADGRPTVAPAFCGEKLSAILKGRAAGNGEWDRPAGTSKHTDRVSDLLRIERGSVVVGTGVAFCEKRASGVGRISQRRAITKCVSNVRKEVTLGGNQRRRVLRHERIQLGRQQRRCILISMRL
jgi:hypothetical protein